MVRSVERYPNETIVVVHGKLRKAPQRIKNATVHDYELEIYEIHKVVDLAENVPFSVYDAENINREREDIDEGDDAGEESTPMSPADSEEISLRSQELPRRSTDIARVSQDLLSRSKSDIFIFQFTMLTPSRQFGYCPETSIPAPKGETP